MDAVLAYLDDNDRTAAHLTGLAFFVDFAQTGPFTELLIGIDADEWNLMFIAQGCDQFLVLSLVAAFGQDSKNSLSPARKDIQLLISITNANR